MAPSERTEETHSDVSRPETRRRTEMAQPVGNLKKLTKRDEKRIKAAAKKYGPVVRMPRCRKNAVALLADMFGIKK